MWVHRALVMEEGWPEMRGLPARGPLRGHFIDFKYR